MDDSRRVAELLKPLLKGEKGDKGEQGEKGDKGDKGDPGIQGPKGSPGTDGLPGKDGINGKDGAPGKDGVNGKDGAPGTAGSPGVNGKDGVGRPGKDGKNGSPDSAADIARKINESKEIISKERIEGFADLENMARTADVNTRVAAGNSGSYNYNYDLSSLLNGVTKTFTLPQNARVLLVLGSSVAIFRPTVDYTTTASTITFTAGIDAATSLSLGQTIIILYKIL